MALRVGDKEIRRIYIGDKPIKRVYLGSELVWEDKDIVEHDDENQVPEIRIEAQDTEAKS